MAKKAQEKEFPFGAKLAKKFKPEARCMGCKERTEVKDPILVVRKEANGSIRFAVKGICSTKRKVSVYAFLAKAKGQEYFKAIRKEK